MHNNVKVLLFVIESFLPAKSRVGKALADHFEIVRLAFLRVVDVLGFIFFIQARDANARLELQHLLLELVEVGEAEEGLDGLGIDCFVLFVPVFEVHVETGDY